MSMRSYRSVSSSRSLHEKSLLWGLFRGNSIDITNWHEHLSKAYQDCNVKDFTQALCNISNLVDDYDLADEKPDFHKELRRCINDNLSAYSVIDKAWARAVTHCCMQSIPGTSVWVLTDSYYWSHLIIEALSVTDKTSDRPFKRAFERTMLAWRDHLPLQVDTGPHLLAVVPEATRAPSIQHDQAQTQEADPPKKLYSVEEVTALLNKTNGKPGTTQIEPITIVHEEIISEHLSERPRELMTFDFNQLAYFSKSSSKGSLYGFITKNADSGDSTKYI